MKQKLVTIYLENMAYGKGKTIFASFAEQHGLVEEHLTAELAEGWRIGSITGFGGNSDGISARGWLAVVLEK